MKKIILGIVLTSLIACGKHETQNFGFTNNKTASQGSQPTTVDDFLMLYIDTSDRTGFEKTLDEGADINLVLKNGRPLLVHATVSNNPLFVSILVRRGADLTLADGAGKTALQHALELKKNRIVMILDPTQQQIKQQELFQAITDEDVDAVDRGLKAGADPNFVHESGETPLTQSIQIKAIGVFRTVARWQDPELGVTGTDVNLPNAAGVTPLKLATEKNYKNFITDLKKLNAVE